MSQKIVTAELCTIHVLHVLLLHSIYISTYTNVRFRVHPAMLYSRFAVFPVDSNLPDGSCDALKHVDIVSELDESDEGLESVVLADQGTGQDVLSAVEDGFSAVRN